MPVPSSEVTPKKIHLVLKKFCSIFCGNYSVIILRCKVTEELIKRQTYCALNLILITCQQFLCSKRPGFKTSNTYTGFEQESAPQYIAVKNTRV